MEHPALAALLAELTRSDWVSDVWLHGSLATGDHRPGVSDIDVVATTTRVLGRDDVRALERLHRDLDAAWRGSAIGCTYVDETQVATVDLLHPAWTHGRLVRRRLSLMVRAELCNHGRVLVGREPLAVLGRVSPDGVREAVRQELMGYWSWAARRPWLFLDPAHADLALISMARARLTLATGQLVTKTDALAHVRAAPHVVDGVRWRRLGDGRAVVAAPALALGAWRDTRRTITATLPA